MARVGEQAKLTFERAWKWLGMGASGERWCVCRGQLTDPAEMRVALMEWTEDG